MDNFNIYDALCSIDESDLDEYAENCKAIKKHQRMKKQVITFSVCFVFVITASVLLIRSGVLSENNVSSLPSVQNADTTSKSVTTSNSLNTTAVFQTEYSNNSAVTESPLVTADNGNTKGDMSNSASYYVRLNGKLNVSGELKEAIENSPDAQFAVSAVYCPTTADITDFVYEGKTLREIAIDADNERILPEKMTDLLKNGEALKYGAALYETGTPDGEKWDRDFYEKKVEFIGAELLAKYIVDGRFLREQLEADLAVVQVYNETSAREKYKLAYNAYLDTFMPEVVNRLIAENIDCKRAEYSNNAIEMYVTAQLLENLPLENADNWYFELSGGELKSEQGVVSSGGMQITN